jgi:isopenicillin-N N-acyltransferase-like protein
MSTGTYPHVNVAGSARECGRQYGEQARDRVARSIAVYASAYRQTAGLSWADALAVAGPFAAAIERFEPRYAEELRGLAEGAAQELDAILALNVRTEIMLSATARTTQRAGECTAIAALPAITDSGHTLLAQNWDWLPHTTDTLVVLEALPNGRPGYVTVVEAGLLAKAGMNSHGVGVATNALISADDAGEAGVPYHVLLRGLLDAEDLSTAVSTIERRERSSSANYLVAQAGGQVVDVEARPGDRSRLSLIEPQQGLLTHTNHFLGSPAVADVGISWAPDSPLRLDRARELLHRRDGAVSVAGLQAVLSDHANHPAGICTHADPSDAPMDQGQTAASLIMDLDERLLWLADGNPCTAGYRRLDYSGSLGPGRP